MDGHSALLWAAIAVQLYSAVDEVRSLLLMGTDGGGGGGGDDDDDDDVASHLQTLSTNTISAISTLLTVVRGAQLRRTRQSLDRIERSLRTVGATGTGGRRHVRVWSALAVAAFGYLKYGQLTETRGTAGKPYASVVAALVCTVSAAGNYYVTVMFVDHVILANRSVMVLRTVKY